MSHDGSAPPEEAAEDAVIQRRRRSDWNGQPRDGSLGSPAYIAGVRLAAATLAAHDEDTADHSDDVVEVSEAIAERLGVAGPERELLAAVAQLHDLGKIAVPEDLLRKAGPLSEDEWAIIREHTIEGERMLCAVPEMEDVGKLVRHTHERFDGKGYPDGLAGERIPLAARIVFCADAFHAMRCDRPYRAGRPAAAALAEIKAGAGTQFDPDVANALCAVAADMGRRKGALRASSQRLAALLLTLVVGGGALAATGTWRDLPFAGGRAEATEPCASCAPAEFGDLGLLPASAATAASAAAAERAAKRPPAGRGDAGRKPGEGAPGGPLGTRRGANAGPGSSAPQAPGRGATRRPTGPAGGSGSSSPVKAPKRSPGRSGEAPRRPAAPVNQGGGAPGRSDEAPGKPSGPGKFGQKD